MTTAMPVLAALELRITMQAIERPGKVCAGVWRVTSNKDSND